MGPAVAGAATAGHRRGREEGKGREGGEKEGEGKGRGAGERASRGVWKPTNTTAIATATAASAPLSGHHTKRPLNARAPSPRRASPPTYGSPVQPANPCVALPSPAYRAAAPLSVTDSPPSAVDSSRRPALLPPPPLQSRFHTLAPPCSLTRDSPCSPRTSAIHFFPAPRLFPVCCPLPLPYPLAQLRSGVRASPLRDMWVQPITATRSRPLPFSAAAGRARSPVRAGYGAPCVQNLPATQMPYPPSWAWWGAGVERGRAGGPFPTDAAWGPTRGLFENLTVGVRGLGLPAAIQPGRYTWHPLRAPPPRPHKDGG